MTNYPVTGQVERKNGDMVPLVDIPMMSDERWIELTNTPEQIARRKLHSIQKGGSQ